MSSPGFVPLSDRFERALVYAAQVHAAQLRKGTQIPYIAHLLAVAALVLQNGGDEDEAIAALLHDAPEDHGGEARLSDIRIRFGPRVEAIVRSCCDALPAPGEPKEDWKVRKDRYLAHLTQVDRSVLLVAAADKLDNVRAVLGDYRVLREALWERFNAPEGGTLWYFGRCVDILEPRLGGPLANELAEAVRILGSLVPQSTRDAASAMS